MWVRPAEGVEGGAGRFIKKLAEHVELVMEVFEDLVARLGEWLPDFGRRLAADGKAIGACRRDDADAAVDQKKQGHPDGEGLVGEWFGYMLCDATYEFPIAFELTPGAVRESPKLLELVDHMGRCWSARRRSTPTWAMTTAKTRRGCAMNTASRRSFPTQK